jgi:photosystem II stability/assembly factor-like uncharacterized protein
MKAKSAPIYLAGALCGLLILAGCVPGSPSPVPTPPPTSGEGPTSTPLSPGTNTPAAEATPTGTVAPEPTIAPTSSTGQPLWLYTLHMLDASEGWATGGVAPADGNPPPYRDQHVYRTSDGGILWGDVSPADMAAGTFASAYFLDASHAWVASAPEPSGESGPVSTTFTVFRTEDGGETWQESEPVTISGGGPGVFSFPDAQHGWMMASLGVAMSHEAVAILHTTDGGMHWGQVSLTSGMEGESTASSLPFVCDKTGFAFSDDSTGWAGGACPGAQLFFYVSHDAGSTWQAVLPPPPAGYSADVFSHCQCVVGQPTFLSPHLGFVSIQIYEAQEGAYLYVTQDGGLTWAARALPTAHLTTGGPDVVDANTGWLTDGQQLYVTHDAGTSWTAVGPLPFSGQDLRWMEFVDASHGWLQGNQVYRTDDGGESWVAVSPTLSTP